MSDLAEIFERDPLQLTKLDLEKTVAYYREMRAKFVQAGEKKITKPKAAKPTGVQLDLGDL